MLEQRRSPPLGGRACVAGEIAGRRIALSGILRHRASDHRVELGRQVGRGYREFRKFQQGIQADIEGAFHDDDDADGSVTQDGADHPPGQIEARKPDHSAPPEPPPADTTS